MKLVITRMNEMVLVGGKVVDVREGTGQATGRVVNVKIEGSEWNKEEQKEEKKILDIAFWNSDKPDGKQLADRVKKAGVKAGSFITALVLLKDDGKAHGIDFRYSGVWVFPATGEKKEINVFVGSVASFDEDPEGRYVRVSVPTKDRNGETVWNRITFWNSDDAAMADRAKACLKPKSDGRKAHAVIVCGAKTLYNDSPAYTGFRFDLV